MALKDNDKPSGAYRSSRDNLRLRNNQDSPIVVLPRARTEIHAHPVRRVDINNTSARQTVRNFVDDFWRDTLDLESTVLEMHMNAFRFAVDFYYHAYEQLSGSATTTAHEAHEGLTLDYLRGLQEEIQRLMNAICITSNPEETCVVIREEPEEDMPGSEMTVPAHIYLRWNNLQNTLIAYRERMNHYERHMAPGVRIPDDSEPFLVWAVDANLFAEANRCLSAAFVRLEQARALLETKYPDSPFAEIAEQRFATSIQALQGLSLVEDMRRSSVTTVASDENQHSDSTAPHSNSLI